MTYSLQVRPLESKKQNNLEIFNEICLTVVSYSMFCFTSLIEDPQVSIAIGYLMIATTCFNLLANMLLILHSSYPSLKKAIINLKQKVKIAINSKSLNILEKDRNEGLSKFVEGKFEINKERRKYQRDSWQQDFQNSQEIGQHFYDQNSKSANSKYILPSEDTTVSNILNSEWDTKESQLTDTVNHLTENEILPKFYEQSNRIKLNFKNPSLKYNVNPRLKKAPNLFATKNNDTILHDDAYNLQYEDGGYANDQLQGFYDLNSQGQPQINNILQKINNVAYQVKRPNKSKTQQY